MAQHYPRHDHDGRVMAVLGPTNTGKTHLAIERLCAHSSGMIGFPLRLLAREVYDKVVAIKGASRVALITGEERIEPRDARWLLCTTEAMPMASRDLAFVALDEAQLGADRERGHVFTDRLLHARGRDETMLLGSGILEPLVRKLVPEAEIVSRPRFSTLTHIAPIKLSRLPPRSAVVAFSAEQVYAVAEMLRRFRGGAAVVMGALSPETRNRQVAMYQAGEVDYLVATDAIGMGLNLDVSTVAFAGLSKFDGQRQRRLMPAEMAQIAGRAGRHQRDGAFTTLAGFGGSGAAFSAEEMQAIEDHRFAPLTRLFWRNPEPRFDSAEALIADLELAPARPELAPAPEAIDLGVLKLLAAEPDIAAGLRGARQIERFWEVCRLPDFRQHGVDNHARFVSRLWQDLRHGPLGGDYVAQAIAQLDNPGGDIDTLQMRIAAIRSWSYITQRQDWVVARDEMAARARAVEARLSDALHARLTERFVNRRTAVLMRQTGKDARLLPVRLDNDSVMVEDQMIGTLKGFRFAVDPQARLVDRKLLLAAAERHLPELVHHKASALIKAVADGTAALDRDGAHVRFSGDPVARIDLKRGPLHPRVKLEAAALGDAGLRARLEQALQQWLDGRQAPLAPLRALTGAAADLASGPHLRALLIRLAESGGVMPRADSGVDVLDGGNRAVLRKLGVRIGALDLFVPAMLKPAAQAAWCEASGDAEPAPTAPPVIAVGHNRASRFGYRLAGKQAVRVDIAEKLLRAAHHARTCSPARAFTLDPALAVSTGLTTATYANLLRQAGFFPVTVKPLPAAAHGPLPPLRWRWRPPRGGKRGDAPVAAHDRPATGPFAALIGLVT